MSTLVVQELKSGENLEHVFKLGLSLRYPIAAFYPYLLMVNAPVGEFKFELLKAGNVLYSRLFTADDVKASLGTENDNVEVFFPIVPEYPIHLDRGLYTARLSATGYAFSFGSFIGWVQQHENLNNEMDYTPLFDTENPLALKMKQFKEGITI